MGGGIGVEYAVNQPLFDNAVQNTQGNRCIDVCNWQTANIGEYVCHLQPEPLVRVYLTPTGFFNR